MWKEGSLKIGNSIFHYWLKVYETGSEFGIDGGKVSKLILKCDGEIVANYDRGWDIKPETAAAELAVELLLQSVNN
jgi:hypothetical protein